MVSQAGSAGAGRTPPPTVSHLKPSPARGTACTRVGTTEGPGLWAWLLHLVSSLTPHSEPSPFPSSSRWTSPVERTHFLCRNSSLVCSWTAKLNGHNDCLPGSGVGVGWLAGIKRQRTSAGFYLFASGLSCCCGGGGGGYHSSSSLSSVLPNPAPKDACSSNPLVGTIQIKHIFWDRVKN